MDFKELGIKKTYSMKEPTNTNKTKYCHFYKSHMYNTNRCMHLKATIEKLIKKGRLNRYNQKEGHKDGHGKKIENTRQDESPKKK